VFAISKLGQIAPTLELGSLFSSLSVARDEAYNLSVDSYSFAVLFWQICSLQTPYAGYNQETHALHVVERGQRPRLDKSWPQSWNGLMSSAWSADPTNRPPMDEVTRQLTEMVAEMSELDGVVPSRASEIRAKRKRKKVSRENQVLDADTRKASASNGGNSNGLKSHGGII
jgi:Protein tyrosine and serine/threonine kinase